MRYRMSRDIVISYNTYSCIKICKSSEVYRTKRHRVVERCNLVAELSSELFSYTSISFYFIMMCALIDTALLCTLNTGLQLRSIALFVFGTQLRSAWVKTHPQLIPFNTLSPWLNQMKQSISRGTNCVRATNVFILLKIRYNNLPVR